MSAPKGAERFGTYEALRDVWSALVRALRAAGGAPVRALWRSRSAPIAAERSGSGAPVGDINKKKKGGHNEGTQHLQIHGSTSIFNKAEVALDEGW